MAWETGYYSSGFYLGWTVAAGDVALNRYWYDATGKKCTWNFYITTATLAGTPASLQITHPLGLVSAKSVGSPCWISDNGTAVAGLVQAVAGDFVITISRADAANFSVSTNNTTVIGQITYEVT